MSDAVFHAETVRFERDVHFELTERFLKTVRYYTSRSGECRPSLEVGELAGGRYRVMQILGKGGRGVVYQVHDEVRETVCALKIPTSSVYQTPSGHLRFKQEFIYMSALDHPNLPGVMDYGVTEKGEPFLVLEFLPGNELPVTRAVGLDEFFPVLVQVLRALGFIHDRGYLHRDVKPANIIVQEEPAEGEKKIRLLDFGLMCRIGSAEASEVAEGTPDYMAPEVIGCGAVDPRTDIYSVGIIAFQLLTGRHPFPGENVEELFAMHRKAERPWVSACRPEIPEGLDRLIHSMMAANMRDRPASVEDVLIELSCFSDKVTRSDLEGRRAYLSASELIGREHEMEALQESMTAAEAGRGDCVLISGVTGSGKSRLLREAQIAALMSGFAIGGVAIRQHDRAPYQALRTIFLSLAPFEEGDVDREKRFPVLNSWMRTEKSTAVSAGGEGGISPCEERQIIIREAAEWIRGISARRPVLLLADDLQWSDESSVLVLHALSHRMKQDRVFLLGAFRSDEFEQGGAVDSWKEAPEVRNLPIQGFTREQTAKFIDSLLGSHLLRHEVIEKIFATTEGTPVSIISLLDFLIQKGQLLRKKTLWLLAKDDLEIPGSLKSVLRERILATPGKAREVLLLLAVAGGRLTMNELVTISGRSDIGIFAATEELVDRKLAEDAGDVVAICHDTIREQCYEIGDAEILRKLHQRIAEFWETEIPVESRGRSALLGHHFSRGTNLRKGLRYLEEAGKLAFQREQHEVAVDLLSEALSVHEALPDEPDRDSRIYEIRKMLAKACVSHNYELGAESADWVIREATQRGLLRWMPKLRRRLPRPLPFLIILGVRLPIEILRRGRGVIGELEGDLLDIFLMTAYGANCLASSSKLTSARALAESLRAYAFTRKSLPNALAEVAQAIAKNHQEGPGHAGDWEAACQILRNERRSKRLDPDSRTLAEGVCLYVQAMDDAWEQSPRFQTSYENSVAYATAQNCHFLHHLNAHAMIEYGVYRGAAKIAEEGEADFRKAIAGLGGSSGQREWLVEFAMGQMEIDRGLFGKAERRIKRLLQLEPGYFTEGFGRHLSAVLNLRWGKLEEAREDAARALEWASEPEVRSAFFEFRVLGVLADILTRQGQWEEARTAVERMEPFLSRGTHPTPYFAIEMIRRKSVLLAFARSQDAEDEARTALKLALELGCPKQIAETRVNLAQVLSLTGAPEPDAIEQLRQAEEIYDGLDNRHMKERVGGCVRKIAQREWKARREGEPPGDIWI